MEIRLPRAELLHLLGRIVQDILALEEHFPFSDAAGIRQNAHNGISGDALAAAAFADDAQDLAGIQIIGDAVDGFDFAGVRKEGGMEVFDLKQWRFTHTITSLTWGRRRHGDRRPGG